KRKRFCEMSKRHLKRLVQNDRNVLEYLKLGTYKLPQTNNLKILGLTFDHKLTCKTHINNLKAECQRRINIIKSIVPKWGADQTVILKTYRALVRTNLNYGSIVYASAKPHIINSLNSIHSSGLRLALGAFRSSPITSILAESHQTPLDIRREKLSLTFACKISVNPNNPTY
ncbi:hypothetical protein X777_12850, partial [Ooceraea biroi]